MRFFPLEELQRKAMDGCWAYAIAEFRRVYCQLSELDREGVVGRAAPCVVGRNLGQWLTGDSRQETERDGGSCSASGFSTFSLFTQLKSLAHRLGLIIGHASCSLRVSLAWKDPHNCSKSCEVNNGDRPQQVPFHQRN